MVVSTSSPSEADRKRGKSIPKLEIPNPIQSPSMESVEEASEGVVSPLNIAKPAAKNQEFRMKTKEEIAAMTPDELEEELRRLKAGQVKLVGSRPRKRPPEGLREMPVGRRMTEIQKFIESFEYNFIGKEFFPPDKRWPLHRVMNLAKTIIKDALPIKCLEATMLSIYMTRDMPNDLDRIALRFGTTVGGQVYWHIVLAVCTSKGKWGSLGLSRRPDLMYKKLKYDSLADLVEDFKGAYEKIGHRIVKITVGLPIGNLSASVERVYYHFLVVPITKHTKWDGIRTVLSKYTKAMHRLLKQVKTTGGKCSKIENTVCSKNIELDHTCLIYKAPELKDLDIEKHERSSTPPPRNSKDQSTDVKDLNRAHTLSPSDRGRPRIRTSHMRARNVSAGAIPIPLQHPSARRQRAARSPGAV
ncbi:hypothetical protein AAMO2058_000201000 [Amorphochlora amoebiformis]